MMKRAILTTLAAGALSMGLASQAQAAVNLELALAIDGSGSMSTTEFNLQKNAYANVLNNSTILPRDGSVAVGVYLFSTSVTQIFPITAITNANIASLISAINGMTQPNGNTNIAGAITTAQQAIFSNNITSNRQVIDVSTDGGNNIGNLANARAAALAAGIDQINCIGIGAGANCGPVQGGTGSFTETATNFTDFEDSLRRKIGREIGAVPEPATWLSMMFGFGLMGAAMRRKKVETRVRFAL